MNEPKYYEPVFTVSGQYIGMGVAAEDQDSPTREWAPADAKFFLAMIGNIPADGTIDGGGVWRGGLWHPNPPDPLDEWEDMSSAPKDGRWILALVTQDQFYRDTDKPNELRPVVVRWSGELTGWGMMGHGGLRPTLWLPIRATEPPSASGGEVT